MRKFISITAPGKGHVEVAEHTATDIDDLREKLFGEKPGDDRGKHPHVSVVEVPETASLTVPSEDDLADADFPLIELAEFSTATHLDLAGVERSAAGRPVDAQPGSMDAAQTGMTHDAGGTVRNTVSPEPTESKVVKEAEAAGHGDPAQRAPTAAQAKAK